METPEIYRLKLSRNALRRIPKKESDFLFGACHLANELNILHKLCLWSTRKGLEEDEPTQHGQIAQALFLLRLLSGKLKEGHILLTRFYWGSKLSTTYHDLLVKDAQHALDKINRYFQRPQNLVTSIRNDFAFHYSPPASGAALEIIPEEEELTFYAAPLASNCLYYFSEVLAGTAMLGEVSESSFGQLLDDLVSLSKHFFAFISGYLAAFETRFPEVFDSSSGHRMHFQELPNFSDVVIPFFTTDPA